MFTNMLARFDWDDLWDTLKRWGFGLFWGTFALLWATLMLITLGRCGYMAVKQVAVPALDVMPAPKLSAEDAVNELRTIAPSTRHSTLSCRHLWSSTPATRQTQPWVQYPEHPSFDTHASLLVIFVHGYNTNASEALDRGRVIESLMPEDIGVAWHLITFLWRGDFGEVQFPRAQESATLSGASLALLLQQLHTDIPGFRLVIISHSLGARVTLEAFRIMRRENSPPPDTLLMLQPAIRVDEISKWNGRMGLSSYADHGIFHEAIHHCRRIVYTASANDSVLLKYFSTGDRGQILFGGFKPWSHALGLTLDIDNLSGSPTYVSPTTASFDGRESRITNADVIDITPAGHSSLFDSDRAVLAGLLQRLLLPGKVEGR